MKIPQSPPPLSKLIRSAADAGRIQDIIFGSIPGLTSDRYHHWDRIRHLTPPEGFTTDEWWLVLKYHRGQLRRNLPLVDVAGEPFAYVFTDPVPERLHEIDLSLGGSIGMPEQVTNRETKDRYLVSSLIEEAITSSQLEGAAATREAAKEMLRANRKPRDVAEQMILNNYLTMRHLANVKDRKLTPELIHELHTRVTRETLENSVDAGQLRSTDQVVRVYDTTTGEILHDPPPASQLSDRLDRMCAFANEENDNGFVHPVLRSIILHFWLAYDHPFVDGNGRTARALFYWSMLRRQYWLCEYISISEVLLKSPSKYARSFLYAETDENDLTYFILHQLEVIRRAIDQLRRYVRRKTQQLHMLEAELRATALLNHRQRALVGHALRHPKHVYSVESHRRSHNVVHQTARSDLLDLVDRSLLTARKVGREWRFSPAPDLEQKLRE